MARKVQLRSSNGKVFEADVMAVMSYSGLLKNVIEDTGTDAVISVPGVSGDILKLVIQFCEARHQLGFSRIGIFAYDPLTIDASCLEREVNLFDCWFPEWQSDPLLNVLSPHKIGVFDITRSGQEILGDERRWHAGKEHRAGIINVNDRETHEDERSWEEKEHDASFLNEVCRFHWDTIKGLHEAAKYLDIPSLQFLTSTLISQAPSRAFLGVVSPWLDCDGLEGYRKLEVEVF